MYDLIVIGAGPAGASAAITAKRSGAHVLLIEKGSFPRQKVCGEFVSAESLGLLSDLLSLERRALIDGAVPLPKAHLFLDGRKVVAPVDPPARSIARLDLDLALWESAGALGVETAARTTVHSIAGSGPFVVTSSQGDFPSRSVINATGRWSNLHAGARTRSVHRQKWIGIKAHFAESSPPTSVDLYFFEGGYCGVQPVDLEGAGHSGRVNASAMVLARAATTLREVFALHPTLHERTKKWEQLGDSITTSPLIFTEPECVVDNVLRAGDAAAFVDPFVGDGISLALRSGALAAESLQPFFAGTATLSQAANQYRMAYTDRLAPIFRASSHLRRLLRLPKPVRAPMLFVVSKTPALTGWLVRKTR